MTANSRRECRHREYLGCQVIVVLVDARSAECT
jgi:hypothetical protein